MSGLAPVIKLPTEDKTNYLGITIDKSKDSMLSEQAFKLLKDYYCVDGETSPQESFARAAVAYSYKDMGNLMDT